MFMKKKILALSVLCILLSGCTNPQNSEQRVESSAPDTISNTLDNAIVTSFGADVGAAPDSLFETYYLPSDDPVYSYLQNNSIRKFFNMWLEEYMGQDIEANWNYDTLAPVQLLNHSFQSIARSGEEFYTCTFSTNDDRYGYIIVSYGEGEEGPYIQKWSLHETTPYLYDLRANIRQITAAVNETDMDLSTASAVRVEWIDTDKNRGDRIILFTDGKEGKYVCYLGDEDYTVEKQ